VGIATLFSEIGRKSLAGISPKALALGARTKTTIPGGGAVALTLFSDAAAQAQRTPVGLSTTPLGPVVTQAAGMAVANVSASVAAIVFSINSLDTAFLTQSSAFIGSPADPRPDQQGGGQHLLACNSDCPGGSTEDLSGRGSTSPPASRSVSRPACR
jgi:hypothetical protein